MQTIQELAQLGYSACEIADIRNCSTSAVKTFCKNRNIKLIKKEEPNITESLKNYFKKKINIKSEDECWEWNGATDPRGYGVMFYKNRPICAHRISYMLYKDNDFIVYTSEKINKNSKIILHSCDNPKCCNPKHLSVGTPKDNTDDMLAKGRGHHQKKFKET